MGWDERIPPSAGKLHSRGKEAAGDATGNDRLKAEGKARQVRTGLKQTGEKIKGIFRKH